MSLLEHWAEDEILDRNIYTDELALREKPDGSASTGDHYAFSRGMSRLVHVPQEKSHLHS